MKGFSLKITFLFLLFLTTVKVFSQTNDGAQLTFGIKAGAAVSTFSHEQPHSGFRLGYTAGVFANYSLSDLLAVQVEANYLQQGGTLLTYRDETRFGAPDNFYTKNQTHSNVTLHNIEIPVLVNYRIAAEGFTPSIYLGPSVAYTFAAHDNFERTGYTSNGLQVTVTGKENVTSTYTQLQVGAVAGASIKLPMGDHFIIIDARYRYGIMPARKDYSYINLNQTSESIRTNTLSFTVGFGF